jgi:hypothetical protein
VKLYRYISPEQVPVQYGGLSVDFCDCNPDFSISDPTTEIPVKPTTKQTVEIAIYEVRLRVFFHSSFSNCAKLFFVFVVSLELE